MQVLAPFFLQMEVQLHEEAQKLEALKQADIILVLHLAF